MMFCDSFWWTTSVPSPRTPCHKAVLEHSTSARPSCPRRTDKAVKKVSQALRRERKGKFPGRWLCLLFFLASRCIPQNTQWCCRRRTWCCVSFAGIPSLWSDTYLDRGDTRECDSERRGDIRQSAPQPGSNCCPNRPKFHQVVPRSVTLDSETGCEASQPYDTPLSFGVSFAR